MEDQIIAAEKSTSISAEICHWSGAVFGILFGLGFFLAEVIEENLPEISEGPLDNNQSEVPINEMEMDMN